MRVVLGRPHGSIVARRTAAKGRKRGVPDRSTFSKNRHGRFRESDLLRRLFETVLHCCIDKGLVGDQGFAIDASLIQADATLGPASKALPACHGMRSAEPSRNLSRSSTMPRSAPRPEAADSKHCLA